MSQTKQNTCSFCGGKGHNLRGCEFAHFAMGFFAPKVQRKCSSCGQKGHYYKTCPRGMPTMVVVDETYKRPRGRTPTGKIWDSEFGFWDDIVVISKTHRARVPMNTHSVVDLYTPTEVVEITLFM